MAIIPLYEVSYLMIQYLQQVGAIFIPNLHMRVPSLQSLRNMAKVTQLLAGFETDL